MSLRRVGLWSLLMLGLLLPSAGCRCFPGFNAYNQAIDCVADHQPHLDNWYNPRLDISRAGRPDWCVGCNRALGACRCEGKPPYCRFSDDYLYPPRYQTTFPGDSLGTGIPAK